MVCHSQTVAEEDLNQLRQEIADKENEVRQLVPEYSRLTEEEGKLITDIRIAEQKCKELNAKRGHQNQFKSPGARDRHLRREIAFLDRQLNENVEQINDIEQSMLEDENDIAELQRTLQVFAVFYMYVMKLERRRTFCSFFVESNLDGNV